MKKMDLGVILITLCALGIGGVFLCSCPQKMVSKPLEVGIALRDSNCYRSSCRTIIKWEKGGDEVVELPFPLLKGEEVAKCEVTLYPYFFFSPRREIEYQRY